MAPVNSSVVVKWLSHDTAHAVGLQERGIIAPGYEGDLILFDPARLLIHAPKVFEVLKSPPPCDVGFAARSLDCRMTPEGRDVELVESKTSRSVQTGSSGSCRR